MERIKSEMNTDYMENTGIRNRGMRARLAAGTWLFAAALLLGGCSKESADEGTDGCRVEITPRSGLPVSVSAQGTPTRSTADPLQEMDMWFVRSDERSAGVWGDYGTAALKAVRTGGSGEQPLTFDLSQYYLTNGLKTRMAGWYPGGATAVGDASGKGYYDAAAGTVSWIVDGSRDILAAPLGIGSKTKAMPVIEFGHALAQVQVYVYADPGVSAQWGQLESIQLLDQNDVCTLKLSDVTEASAPVGCPDAGKTPFTLANAAPLEIPEGKDNAVAFGDPVMIVPQDKNYQLRLQLSAGVHRPKQVLAPPRAYLAGEAVRLYVRFSPLAVEVDPVVTIVDWVTGGELNTYPKVINGNTIVVSDDLGETDPRRYPTHEVWTATPAHAEDAWDSNASGLNTYSRKFEVASKSAGISTWKNAQINCRQYSQASDDAGTWRLPTVRELGLIYNKIDYLTAVSDIGNGYYWAATEAASDSDNAWELRLDTGSRTKYSKDANNSVRCIRDL